MSAIVDNLQKLAEDMEQASAWTDIRSVAVAHLESEGIEKTAAEQSLTNLEDGVEQPAVPGTKELSDIFLKVASYIGELEAKIVTSDEELSDRDAQLSKVAEEQMIEDMSSFTQNGFSAEEARNLAALPEETLQKLASTVQIAPSPLGKGAGMDKDSMDPMLAFCMS